MAVELTRSIGSSSSSSSTHGSDEQWKYDVFLSFRGEDTRGTFTSHLYHALVDAGVNAFIDSEELNTGEEIGLGLLQAIRGSQISVVVLSPNYANSRWCLQELEEIMKWAVTSRQIVLPVFYHVDPSDVRRQKGCFAKVFDHEAESKDQEKVSRWMAALTQVGKLSGYVMENDRCDEARIVEKIVRRISNALYDQTYLNVAKFPVGLDYCLPKLQSLPSLDSPDVLILGILGMGGIGKTTLAKAIYNQLFLHFEGKSFLADVRENSRRPKGILRMQKQLLHDTTISKKNHLYSTEQGIRTIKSHLRRKRVLIVLDDVSDTGQVRNLAGGHDWFGQGSLIIVTTRDLDLLKAIKADKIYEAKPLNDDDSLQLFCSYAFGQRYPDEEFKELSEEVLSYCKGVPLALEVLGGSLLNRSADEWKPILEKLKIIPHERIQQKLRISFDEFGRDDRTKELFLDIACFFVGWDKDYVVKILDACGLFARKGIRDLINKGLVEVDEQNKLQMHAFFRDMGREIVREESPNNPGKRSRLWCSEDILSTFRSRLGTEAVEGIALQNSLRKVKVKAEAFASMNRLRLLRVNNVELQGDQYELVSKELRWLCWHGFLSRYIPDDFDMEQLVALDMQNSLLREVWRDHKVMRSLKVLNLSRSVYLTKTPDFLMLPCLEKLILKYCTSLEDIHESIGHLERLVLADFKGCGKLKRLPDSIYRLGELRKLVISGCLMGPSSSELRMLSPIEDNSECDILGDGEDAVSMHWTPSFDKVASLKEVSRVVPRRHLRMASLSGLNSLRTLKLRKLKLSDDSIPDGFENLVSLEYLDLRINDFRFLPDTISYLPKLKKLQLDGCKQLEVVPDMPRSLIFLSAVRCSSLKRITMSNIGPETRLFLTNCYRLRKISGLSQQTPGGTIHLENCHDLEDEFKEFLLKEWCGQGQGSVFLPGSDIPNWFLYQSHGSSLCFQVPSFQGCKPDGLTVCVIYSLIGIWGSELWPLPRVSMEPLDVSFSAVTYSRFPVLLTDYYNHGRSYAHLWMFHLPSRVIGNKLETIDQVKLTVDLGCAWTVKKLGVHFQNAIGPS